MGFDQPSHWLIVIVAAMVLFGYKKLPEMSRSVGRSLRIFKTEMKGMSEDDTARDAEGVIATPTVVAGPVAPVNGGLATTATVAAVPVTPPNDAAPVVTQPTTNNGATVKQMGV